MAAGGIVTYDGVSFTYGGGDKPCVGNFGQPSVWQSTLRGEQSRSVSVPQQTAQLNAEVPDVLQMTDWETTAHRGFEKRMSSCRALLDEMYVPQSSATGARNRGTSAGQSRRRISRGPEVRPSAGGGGRLGGAMNRGYASNMPAHSSHHTARMEQSLGVAPPWQDVAPQWSQRQDASGENASAFGARSRSSTAERAASTSPRLGIASAWDRAWHAASGIADEPLCAWTNVRGCQQQCEAVDPKDYAMDHLHGVRSYDTVQRRCPTTFVAAQQPRRNMRSNSADKTRKAATARSESESLLKRNLALVSRSPQRCTSVTFPSPRAVPGSGSHPSSARQPPPRNNSAPAWRPSSSNPRKDRGLSPRRSAPANGKRQVAKLQSDPHVPQIGKARSSSNSAGAAFTDVTNADRSVVAYSQMSQVWLQRSALLEDTRKGLKALAECANRAGAACHASAPLARALYAQSTREFQNLEAAQATLGAASHAAPIDDTLWQRLVDLNAATSKALELLRVALSFEAALEEDVPGCSQHHRLEPASDSAFAHVDPLPLSPNWGQRQPCIHQASVVSLMHPEVSSAPLEASDWLRSDTRSRGSPADVRRPSEVVSALGGVVANVREALSRVRQSQVADHRCSGRFR